MKAVKGRVLEVGENFIIVLTAEGDFLKRPLPAGNIQIGDEVEIPLQRRGPYFRYAGSAVAAVAVVVCLMLSSIGTITTPAYYVHVDIPGNSSVELALSRNMRVLEATPLNEAGKTILNEAPVVRKSAGSAIGVLVKTAGDLEYFAPDKENTLLISIAGGGTKIEPKTRHLIQGLTTAAKKQLESAQTTATLGIATVDNSTRDEALSKKGSMNALLFNMEPLGKTKDFPKEYKVSRVVSKQDKKATKTVTEDKTNSGRKKKLEQLNIFNLFQEKVQILEKRPSAKAPEKSKNRSGSNSGRNIGSSKDEWNNWWDRSVWVNKKNKVWTRDNDHSKNDRRKKNTIDNNRIHKEEVDRDNGNKHNIQKNRKSWNNDRNNYKDRNKRDTKNDKGKWHWNWGDNDKNKNKWNRYDRKNDGKKKDN